MESLSRVVVALVGRLRPSCDQATGIRVLIPEQAAPLFRNDGAPLFRSIAARRSDQSSPPIPG